MYTEKLFESYLWNILNEKGLDARILEDIDFLTEDKGVLIKLEDGSEFYVPITIVSKHSKVNKNNNVTNNNNSDMEIEKKYLIKSEIPEEWYFVKDYYIEQNYLATGDEEIRIRKVVSESGKEDFYFTFKKGSGLKRKELEEEISKGNYKQLLNNCKGKSLKKKRSIYRIEKESRTLLLEVDTYEDFDFITAELEFNNEQEALLFNADKYLGVGFEDITEDKRYKNQNLWLELQNK